MREIICRSGTRAYKAYQRDVLRFMAAYAVVLFCSSWFVKHDGGERFFLYFWSVLPALPIVGLIGRMARYLNAETDEFQRLQMMHSILIGTAVLLAMLVVNDFLRAFAHAGALSPFIGVIGFFMGMAGTQIVQRLRNRVPADDQ